MTGINIECCYYTMFRYNLTVYFVVSYHDHVNGKSNNRVYCKCN